MESFAFFLLLTWCGFSLADQSAAPPNLTTKMDSLFHEYALPGAPGASVMVIKDGKVWFEKAYGLANLEEKIASTTQTNYRLASVTKQFTAMAILLQIERQQLRYDDNLLQFFPNFPNYGIQITIRHLLSHTSGLIDYEDLIPPTTVVPLRDRQVLELLQQQDSTYFAPGTKFKYSNSGYALLALIVETVSGESFAKFLAQNIFHLLKMKNTVAFEQGISTVSRRAYGYRRRQDSFEKYDQSLTSSVLGDGGIYSSIADLYRWDQALYTEKLVSHNTIAAAFTPQVVTDQPGISYGYGWFIETYRNLKTIWHYGSTVGFRTAIERFPEQKFTVIVLINRDEANAHQLARQVVDWYLFDQPPETNKF